MWTAYIYMFHLSIYFGKNIIVYYCEYIYIYTLGAGGSPKVLWVGYCEWLKIVISLWRNVSFWRSHSLHRIVICADEFFLIRVLIDQKSIIHTFIFVRNARNVIIPTPPHPNPMTCVAPTMCASARNMMLRSTDHVCKFKERYHPHPTPPQPIPWLA